MGKLNENQEYLKHMLSKFKDCNISISINGYDDFFIRGTKNIHVSVSGDIRCMHISLHSEFMHYSNTFTPNTSQRVRRNDSIEEIIGQALLKILDNTSGNI